MGLEGMNIIEHGITALDLTFGPFCPAYQCYVQCLKLFVSLSHKKTCHSNKQNEIKYGLLRAGKWIMNFKKPN